jgi:hypothetical protein
MFNLLLLPFVFVYDLILLFFFRVKKGHTKGEVKVHEKFISYKSQSEGLFVEFAVEFSAVLAHPEEKKD